MRQMMKLGRKRSSAVAEEEKSVHDRLRDNPNFLLPLDKLGETRDPALFALLSPLHTVIASYGSHSSRYVSFQTTLANCRLLPSGYRISPQEVEALLTFKGKKRLLTVDEALEVCIIHMIHMGHQNFSFSSAVLLLRELSRCLDGILDSQAQLLSFLTRPSCNLLPKNVEVDFSHARDLYLAGRAGPLILQHLKHAEQEGARFKSFEHMLNAMVETHLSYIRSKTQIMELGQEGLVAEGDENQGGESKSDSFSRTTSLTTDEKAVWAYLCSADCALLADPETESQHLARSATMELLAEVGGLQKALTALRRLNRAHRRFQGFFELRRALTRAIETNFYLSREDCDAIADYLASPECNLFHHTSVDASKLSMAHIELLLYAANGRLSCLSQLQVFSASGKQFRNFQELLDSLTEVVDKGGDYKKVFEVLTDPMCKLLSMAPGQDPMKLVDIGALSVLIMEAGGVQNVLAHLGMFELADRHFQRVEDITAAVSRALSTGSYVDDADRIEVLERLSGSLFFAGGPSNFQPTANDVDSVVIAAKGKSNALEALERFSRYSRTFSGFPELVHALRQEGMSESQRLIALREVKDFLLSSGCHLFAPPPDQPVQLLEEELDALVNQAGGPQKALDQLRLMNAISRTFSTMDELVQAFKVPNKIEICCFFFLSFAVRMKTDGTRAYKHVRLLQHRRPRSAARLYRKLGGRPL